MGAHAVSARLEPAVHQALLVQLAEDPPHALHEGRVQRLVALLEVDPAPDAPHRLFPVAGVPGGAHGRGESLRVTARQGPGKALVARWVGARSKTPLKSVASSCKGDKAIWT